jgi:hypothetical protein
VRYDHSKPYPYGPTHPSNTKLYCRTDHLLKTFYAGFGWTEQQFPDGTVGVMMPTRRQTREQDRRDRITKERHQRKELNAEEEQKQWAWRAANEKPPPF